MGTLGHSLVRGRMRWGAHRNRGGCSRTPQPLTLLKRQQFGLVGRPVSPYSPAHCWQLPAPLSIPARRLVRRGWREFQLQGFSPGSAAPEPVERAGDAEVCRDALEMPLLHLKRFKGPRQPCRALTAAAQSSSQGMLCPSVAVAGKAEASGFRAAGKRRRREPPHVGLFLEELAGSSLPSGRRWRCR